MLSLHLLYPSLLILLYCLNRLYYSVVLIKLLVTTSFCVSSKSLGLWMLWILLVLLCPLLLIPCPSAVKFYCVQTCRCFSPTWNQHLSLISLSAVLSLLLSMMGQLSNESGPTWNLNSCWKFMWWEWWPLHQFQWVWALVPLQRWLFCRAHSWPDFSFSKPLASVCPRFLPVVSYFHIPIVSSCWHIEGCSDPKGKRASWWADSDS